MSKLMVEKTMKNKKVLIVGGAGLVALIVVLILASSGGELDGTWEYREYASGDPARVYTFSGKTYSYSSKHYQPNFTTGRSDLVEHIEKGKFSITGDKIEFVDEKGSVGVESFSRTANTVRIGETTFTRK